MRDCFPDQFVTKRREMAHLAPAKVVIAKSSKNHAVFFHPSGEPTYLPLAQPFCSCRTYLSRTLPEVAS